MTERETFIDQHLETQVPRSILSSGDFVFHLKNENQIQEFRVSPQGAKLIAKGVDLFGLFTKSYQPEFFDRPYRVLYGRSSKVLRGELGDVEVAVKSVDPIQDLSGNEQFKAIRVLEEAGVRVASPLIASETRMINSWVSGYKVNRSREGSFAFPEFFWRMDRLVKVLAKTPSLDDPKKPMWQDNWFLDCSRHNYFVRDLDAIKLRDKFIAMDPVTYKPVPTWDLYSQDLNLGY